MKGSVDHYRPFAIGPSRGILNDEEGNWMSSLCIANSSTLILCSIINMNTITIYKKSKEP